MSGLPEKFVSAEHLDEVMSTPTPALIADLAEVPGDIVVIGVAGKTGPTVARMAKRARPDRRVIGVARFSEPEIKEYLESHGIETISVDLLDPAAIARLPRVPNVIFLAGRKFGSSGNEPLTWAMNGYVPALIADHYKESRIVAYSTTGVSLCTGKLRRSAGRRCHRATGRICHVLRRARTDVPVLFGSSQNTRRAHPAELRHRHALRRPARIRTNDL